MISNLFLTLILSLSVNSINGQTDSEFLNDYFENYTPQRMNLVNYFSNLTTNIGDNPACICVEVALCMILSYYDTYYNDNIIPETFDVDAYCCNDDFNCFSATSSPGIYSDLTANYYSCSGNTYYMSAAQKQSYLSTHNDFLVNSILPIKRLDANDGSLDLSDRPYIRNYLSVHLNSVNNLYEGFELQAIDVMDLGFDACKEVIDNGYPIIFDAFGEGDNGHATVAFDYHDEFNSLIFHNGFTYGNAPSIYGDMISSCCVPNGTQPGWAFALIPSSSSQHVCSNNYYTYDENNNIEFLCPCMLNGMSYPNHNHSINHTLDYEFDGDEVINYATHYESCSSCGLSKTIERETCDVVSLDNSQHQINLECGELLTENHFIIDVECVGTDIHEGYCVCGSLGYESHDWCLPVMIDGNIRYVCVCGLIYLDHDELWRNYIRDYLRNHNYFDDDFFNGLIEELLNNEFNNYNN